MTFADIGAAVDGGTHRNHEVVGDAIRKRGDGALDGLDTVSVNVLAGCCYQLGVTQPAQPSVLVP